MAGSRMNKRLCIVGLTLLIAAFYGWFRMFILTFSYNIQPRPAANLQRFSMHIPHESAWYLSKCLNGDADEDGDTGEPISISSLEDVLGRWKAAQHPDCRIVYDKFDAIYTISRRSGQIVIPETFQTKVLKWLGNNGDLLKEAKLQFITSVFNKFTHEESVFNPLRAKRPGVSSALDDLDQYIEDLIIQSKDCDLCDYKFKTAEDTFGRIESEHAVTAANTFKYDAYHALVLLKTHHPLRFSEEQFVDMFDVTMKWFMKVHSTDKQYRYPHIMWDCLPKASASQVHPHSQATLSPRSHYGLMEHIRLSALEYGIKNAGRNYFLDLIQIHNALGLTTSLGHATAMAYLTPKKDYEVMIISNNGGQDFVRLLYYTIRAFIDDLQLYAWSFAIFLPKLEPYGAPSAEDIPAVARIISRGPPTSTRNDISSMELFAASNVNIDPFSVIEHIRNSVKVKGHLQAAGLKKIAERKEKLKQEMDELEKQEEELEQQEMEVEKDEGLHHVDTIRGDGSDDDFLSKNTGRKADVGMHLDNKGGDDHDELQQGDLGREDNGEFHPRKIGNLGKVGLHPSDTAIADDAVLRHQGMDDEDDKTHRRSKEKENSKVMVRGDVALSPKKAAKRVGDINEPQNKDTIDDGVDDRNLNNNRPLANPPAQYLVNNLGRILNDNKRGNFAGGRIEGEGKDLPNKKGGGGRGLEEGWGGDKVERKEGEG